MSPKKILVTGGCGFVGANLVPVLINNGFSVKLLDNFSNGSRDLIEPNSSVEIIEGDIRDIALLQALMGDCEVVIHLAAFGSVVDSVADPINNFSINAQGTLTVLEAARQAKVKKFVFSSTGGALIGNATPPVSEKSVPRPISPYGASKLAGEAYCCAYANAYGMEITALRFANVIGPKSGHKKGIVTTLFKAILGNQPIKIYGDGSSTRDYIDVRDLCEGIFSAVRTTLSGFNVFHIASGSEVSVQRMVNEIKQITGAVDHPVIYDSKRAGEVDRNFASYGLAKEKLGFSPKYKLHDTLNDTWRWFKSNSWS